METVNIEKQELSNRIETQIDCNRNTTHLNTEQTRKNKLDNKENDIRRENHISVSNEPRMKNSQGRN